MESPAAPRPSRAALIVGWLLSVLPCLMLLFSVFGKFAGGQPVQEGFQHLGWPIHLAVALGVLELVCTLLYLFPPTAVLGAVLLTGYMGGAIATHVRIGDGFAFQAALGVVLWLGLFLRDPRLRVLLPLRR